MSDQIVKEGRKMSERLIKFLEKHECEEFIELLQSASYLKITKFALLARERFFQKFETDYCGDVDEADMTLLREAAEKAAKQLVADDQPEPGQISGSPVLHAKVEDVSETYALGVEAHAPSFPQSIPPDSVSFFVTQLKSIMNAPIPQVHALHPLLHSLQSKIPLKFEPPYCAYNIEVLFLAAHAAHTDLKSELSHSHLFNKLVLDVWRTLNRLAGGSWLFGEDQADTSTSTLKSKRPDVCVWHADALIAKAETKASVSALEAAKAELISKMPTWNPIALRHIPFLPCVVAGGTIIQFFALFPTSKGTTEHFPISDPFSCTTPQGRFSTVAASINFYQILCGIQKKVLDGPYRLYRPIQRGGDCTVTINYNHVLKKCDPLDMKVYDLLDGKTIPNTTVYKIVPPKKSDKPHLVSFCITPVCAEISPESESDLKCAVKSVLGALVHLHDHGFCHRDIRWSNVLFSAPAKWLLSDFELSTRDGEVCFWENECTPPWIHPEASEWTYDCDIYQVGQLVKKWAEHHEEELSVRAQEFCEFCECRDVDARACLAHDWIAED